MTTLSLEEQQRLFEQLQGERPPTIGVIGVSGAGKSSTINALFKTTLPVSHTVACTKEFWTVPLTITASQGDLKGFQLKLHVVDAPGLGEDLRRDSEYLRMYRENLPRCDVLLYLLGARNRAIALDQKYLSELEPFAEQMVFGISQVDLVHPVNWKAASLVPTQEQAEKITEILSDRGQRISELLRRDIELVPFSAVTGYNLQELFLKIIKSAPATRKWLFDLILNYDLESWVAGSVLRSQSSQAATKPAAHSRQEVDDRPAARNKPEAFDNPKDKRSILGTFLEVVLGLTPQDLRKALSLRVPRELQAKIGEVLGKPGVDISNLTDADLEKLDAEIKRRKPSS